MEFGSFRILNVRSANRISALPNITTHRKNRLCFGLMIKSEGKTTYRTEAGEEMISDKTHVCLLPAGSTYSWTTTGGKCFGIEFDANIDITEPVVFFVKENEELMRLFFNLEQALLSPEDISQLKAITYLYRIFLIILTKNRYSPKCKEELIAKGVDMMKNTYYNPDISVSDFAKASGISDAYFRRIYNEVYGTSPVKALIALRMKKALELLQTDYNSVSAIAEAVGYTNPYHFSKAFKQYYGVAPTKYFEI